MAAKKGRPTKFSDALATTICQRLADGQSLREICREEGMPSTSTVFRWLAERPIFQDQYARAREAQAEHWADEIVEIADDGSNDWMERNVGEDVIVVPDHEHINRSKLRVDARKWLMSKLAPKKYGDRVEIEHSGAIKRASDLNDDDLAAIAAGGGAGAAKAAKNSE